MHGLNVDIGDLLSEARPLPESSLSILRCADCGQSPHSQSFGPGYAIARCRCGEMPIAEGVLLAEPGDASNAAVAAIRGNRCDVARRIVLGKHATRVRLMEMLGMRVTFRRYTRHWLLGELINRARLRPLLEHLGASRIANDIAAASLFNVYLRHRYCAPPLVSAIPLLELLRERDGPVLDAPCGMGHLSFMLSKVVPAEQLVCLDLHPYFVYAARRFFVPDARLGIASDMNKPLPLADASFAAIFCLDALQYISNKRRLASELMRVLRADGFCAILHAQNGLRANRYAGDALSPAEYAALFNGYHVRVYPEGYMLDAFATDAPLDLSRQFHPDELAQCDALHIIAARSPDVFRVVPPLNKPPLNGSGRARLNPLYEAHRDGDRYVLARHLPEGLEVDYNRYPAILPKRVTVPASDVDGHNGHLHFKNPAKLLRMQVLVELPETY